MLTVYLLFVQRNAQAYETALDGIKRAFETARVQTAECVDEVVLKTAPHEKSLLILIEPEMAEIELAVKSSQEDGMERWPVVSLSHSIQSSGLDVIAAEEWQGPLLARVFRAAVQKHELIRENSRMRGDLMTIARRISHDLRAPLSGVFTTAELLKEILDEHSEDGGPLTAPLFDSTQEVLKILDRVSQMTKATLEKKAKETVAMGPVAWAGRQAAERMAIRQGTQMLEPEIWPTVQGVPALLELIWANLLVNAVTHAGKGRTVKMQWRELPDEFEFSVEDDGPGVAPEKRAGLFQPFQKLHLSHSARGLGLSIVRRLVEIQDGRCGYEPGAEGGARFFFTLPKVEPITPSA